MSKLDDLKKVVDHSTKFYRIDTSSDPVSVELIIGLNPDPTNTQVLVKKIEFNKTPAVINYLESSEVQEKILQPRNQGIILVDVVGYSKYDTLGQTAILTLLSSTIKTALACQRIFSTGPCVEQIIPTGDGCYVVFHEDVNDRFVRAACGFKANLHCLQVRMFKEAKTYQVDHLTQITMACHLGEVDTFVDIAGNRNCFGTGMNETARILDLGKKQVKSNNREEATFGTLFFSPPVLPQAEKVKNYLNSISSSGDEITIDDLGKHADKHDIKHHIYWLQGLSNHVTIAFDSVVSDSEQPVFFKP